MKRTGAARRATAFSLVELLCAMAIVAILAALAYPSYQKVLHKVRRAEGRNALLRVHTAQERYRAEHAAYGSSLAQLDIASVTSSGHYTLSIASAGEFGFEAFAAANANQRGDTGCRYLMLNVEAGDAAYASGPTVEVDNLPAANKQCWNP